MDIRVAVAVALSLIVIAWVARAHAGRERYGPPPGMRRAVSHDELGYRGWVEADRVYEGNTASAVSHMIERSA